MLHIGIVDITTVGACICANAIVEKAAELNPSGEHPEFTLHSFSFKRYIDAINKRDWDAVANIILESIEKLKSTGADFIIIPSNTPHFAIQKIQKESPLPVLNIIEIVSDECVHRGFKKVAILGTKFTMQGGLYLQALKDKEIQQILPDNEACELIHNFIMNEIIPSKINSRTALLIAENIKKLPCDVVALACTELPAVYNEENLGIPVIDTTRLIAYKALEYAMSK